MTRNLPSTTITCARGHSLCWTPAWMMTRLTSSNLPAGLEQGCNLGPLGCSVGSLGALSPFRRIPQSKMPRRFGFIDDFVLLLLQKRLLDFGVVTDHAVARGLACHTGSKLGQNQVLGSSPYRDGNMRATCRPKGNPHCHRP